MSDHHNKDGSSKNVDSHPLLAEYLGGELSGSQRAEFEANLHRDPALAAEVASLRSGLASLESLNENCARSVFSNHRERRDVWPRFSGAVLRYAAAIAMAFVAGYALRGSGGYSAPVMPSHDAPPVAAVSTPPSETAWGQRAAAVYAKTAGQPGLGRSLIALAHAGDTTRR